MYWARTETGPQSSVHGKYGAGRASNLPTRYSTTPSASPPPWQAAWGGFRPGRMGCVFPSPRSGQWSIDCKNMYLFGDRGDGWFMLRYYSFYVAVSLPHFPCAARKIYRKYLLFYRVHQGCQYANDLCRGLVLFPVYNGNRLYAHSYLPVRADISE